MKVGLLGGSFNPPHQGHIHLSNLAIKKLRLNQVWWIPTLKNPLKEDVIFEGYVSRVQKCEKLIRNHPKLRLKQFDEIYTEKLINRLKKRFPKIEFFWVMGADNLENFHKWKNFKKLVNSIPIAIFSREKFLQKARKTKVFHVKLQQKFQIFHTKNMNISSTQIRQNELYR
jgi:nicotinate-nucleotide adenylyltransferase